MAEDPLERFERLISELESAEGPAELDVSVRAILPYMVSGSSYLEIEAGKALRKVAEKHPDYDWTYACPVLASRLDSLSAAVRWNVGEILVAASRTSDMDLDGIRRHMAGLIDLFRQAACADLAKSFEGEYSLLYMRIAKAKGESKRRMDICADGEALRESIKPPKGRQSGGGSGGMFRAEANPNQTADRPHPMRLGMRVA